MGARPERDRRRRNAIVNWRSRGRAVWRMKARANVKAPLVNCVHHRSIKRREKTVRRLDIRKVIGRCLLRALSSMSETVPIEFVVNQARLPGFSAVPSHNLKNRTFPAPAEAGGTPWQGLEAFGHRLDRLMATERLVAQAQHARQRIARWGVRRGHVSGVAREGRGRIVPVRLEFGVAGVLAAPRRSACPSPNRAR
jgi:hypothetical protein